MHMKKFCRSAVGAQRSRAGALAGAALRILGRSATRSGAPEIEPERAWSGAPDFAGALILCLFQPNNEEIQKLSSISHESLTRMDVTEKTVKLSMF